MVYVWIFFIFLSLCLGLALRSLLKKPKKGKKNLPPGPPPLSNLQYYCLTKPILCISQLRAKYGPIFTVQQGPRIDIYISGHSLIHKALLDKGSVFSDRPPVPESTRILTGNQYEINTASYGPLWRLLRRNLTSEILSPSNVKSSAEGRAWVHKMLIQELMAHANSGEPVFFFETIQHALFHLILFMCFGRKLDDESTVKKIIDIQQRVLIRPALIFDVLAVFFPSKIGKILFRGSWNELVQIRREQEELLIPFIRSARKGRKQDHQSLFSYVDSLMELDLPDHERRRKLTEAEMVTLCSEFLNGGTRTTATTLQWIMANLVKYPELQQKLADEIDGAVGEEAEMVKEEDLNAMPYLKAVVLEGLRRHPPGHLGFPHAVSSSSSEEVTLEGYIIPKEATINIMVAEMGWDDKVWDDPMSFRPERFLDDGGKIKVEYCNINSGSCKEMIKMMPFGVGRRICPGLNLAMLHLEFFVANLVREFRWKAMDGEKVDLTEKQEFTVVMKNPLKAKVTPRRSM